MEETKSNIFKTVFEMGRKRAFETDEELREKVIEYFTSGRQTKEYYDKKAERLVEVPVLTITGLTLFLGFADRSSFYNYEARGDKKDATEEEVAISYTLKRARTFIEGEYEAQLQTGAATGAIFALKNFGWKDTQTIEGELNDNGVMQVEYVDAPHANYDENGNLIEKE